MKTNRYITKIVAVALVLLSLTGCKGLLDLKPDSSLTYHAFWDTEDRARAAFIGNYTRFRSYAGTFWTLGEVRSDLWGGKAMEDAWNKDLIQNDFNALKAPYGSNFADFYGFIHNLNDFIANAPKSPLASNTKDFNNMMAQMHGIRALVYYTLLKTWGDAVISTDPADGDFIANESVQKRKRAPKAEVMKQVLDDIAKSLEYYEKSGTDNWRNSAAYWSKNATLTLKGDVLLWKGQVLNGGQADFQAAKEALELVKGNLVAYDKLWGIDNERNKEFIFAFDYKENQSSHWYGSLTAKAGDVVSVVDQKGNMVGDYYGFQGGNRYGVSQFAINKLYEFDGDKRQNTFILFYEPGKPVDVHNLASKYYKGAALSKFMGYTDESGERRYWENIPLYRYADVLLLLAEAKNQLGEDPSAEINKIRERAGVAVKYISKSKLDNKRAILDERLREFAGEGKRWWDLVRAGDDLVFDYVTNLKKENRHMIYLPLSNSLISKDPEYITQTEGY
ncbi:SusD family [Chlamydia trachomatis]|nr:SusD family [Chlamydia trachomatis]